MRGGRSRGNSSGPDEDAIANVFAPEGSVKVNLLASGIGQIARGMQVISQRRYTQHAAAIGHQLILGVSRRAGVEHHDLR